ncbi:MAG: T9SS type A sorting domain-containing protein, partial [bacterium]
VDYSSKNISINNTSNLIPDDKYYGGPGYKTYRTHKETDVEVARNGFYPAGQYVLFMNCFTLNNRHSFTFSNHVEGPNVFLDCRAENGLANSEAHHRWSVGGLYDNVSDNIALMNRFNIANGHGWGGANYVAWNTQGTIINEQPPTAQNWSIGHMGEIRKGRFYDLHERDGYFEKTGYHIRPQSLYIQQLIERKGSEVLEKIDYNEKGNWDGFFDQKGGVRNYPNPAVDYTIFPLELENRSKVLLYIYSLEGRKVAFVDYGKNEKGRREFFWETEDCNGNDLDRGVYIFKFLVDGNAYTGKLMIN